jgi:hypothetical protein
MPNSNESASRIFREYTGQTKKSKPAPKPEPEPEAVEPEPEMAPEPVKEAPKKSAQK